MVIYLYYLNAEDTWDITHKRIGYSDHRNDAKASGDRVIMKNSLKNTQNQSQIVLDLVGSGFLSHFSTIWRRSLKCDREARRLLKILLTTIKKKKRLLLAIQYRE